MGRRVPDCEPHLLKVAEYTKHNEIWYARAPSGLVANLANHQVQEHDDGTISVTPSILVTISGNGTWHGYLERGVWRNA